VSFVQRDIADAEDLAKKKYFELTPESERSSEGITAFMNAAMDAKRVKLDSSLAKHLPIADPSLGHEFLVQIKRHYDLCYEEPEMNQEKLQHLVTSKVDAMQKVKWLELWNSTPAFRMSLKFPKMPISDKAFDLWLHKATFWSQV
jgi:hypothetical protein